MKKYLLISMLMLNACVYDDGRTRIVMPLSYGHTTTDSHHTVTVNVPQNSTVNIKQIYIPNQHMNFK